MTRLITINFMLIILAGSLWGQSGFFRSYNHAPWFSDGQKILVFQDSVIVGQSKAVDTTGWFGFTLSAYNARDGVLLDSFSCIPINGSFSVRSPLATSAECVSIAALDLTGGDDDLWLFSWAPGREAIDSFSVPYLRAENVVPSPSADVHGLVVYQPKNFQQFRQTDQHYDGVVHRYSPCGEFLSVDTLYRDTIGRSWLVPNFSDESKYLVRDQDRQKLMLLKYDGVRGHFVKMRPFADNELVAVRHYDDLIVADHLFYYERDGFDLYDETIAVFNDSLDLLWEAPFIPDRTELVPSYYWETRSIHVNEQYITVVGAEDRGENLPNSIESTNHLYSTRYTVDGELVWFRRFDAIDSLLPLYIVSDVEVLDDGSVFAYGHYTHRSPPVCDTCPLTRNTFLLKLDADGYLDGPPTSVEEEVGASSSISVYPNPTKDRLTISSTDVIEQVSIHNIDGRLVYEESGLSDRENIVDVSGLQAGLYVVSVTDQMGRVSTSKVVVQ
jgi:hypothetical protein